MSSVTPDLINRLRAAPPLAGRTRVLGIDGRAGAGKSTLARQLSQELDSALITLDYLYGGWDGLSRGVDLLVSEVFEPLSAGRVAWVPQYDWEREVWREPRELHPTDFLVVEGVGVGAQRSARYLSVLVWLSAAESTRKKRGIERDEGFRSHWDSWASGENEMFERERPWERADFVVSTEPSALYG